jgi:hypothetical protein
MSQWLLTDESEPLRFDDDHNPLPVPEIEINDEAQLQQHLTALMQRPPHVVVLRSEQGDSIAVGIGSDFGWIAYRPKNSSRSYSFIPQTPLANHPLEFRSEAGMSEVLPAHLLPMDDVIRLLRLFCYRNIRPALAGELR